MLRAVDLVSNTVTCVHMISCCGHYSSQATTVPQFCIVALRTLSHVHLNYCITCNIVYSIVYYVPVISCHVSDTKCNAGCEVQFLLKF